MSDKRFHYGWVVILTGLLVTIGAHGFGRMSYTLILPAMKDGLGFNYTQLGLARHREFRGIPADGDHRRVPGGPIRDSHSDSPGPRTHGHYHDPDRIG